MPDADLSGANLYRANLEGANLENTIFALERIRIYTENDSLDDANEV